MLSTNQSTKELFIMQTKQTKTAQALSASFKVHAENLLTDIQTHINTKANIAKSVDLMRKSKVKLGASRKTCAMLAFIFDGLTQLKDAKGKPLTEGTCNNYLSEIKKSVTKGTELNLNSSRKVKPAGQSQTPKSKDASKLVEDNALDIPSMASEDKPAPVKLGAYKSNDDAIAALIASIKTVKTQCTIAQWRAIATLHPSIAKMID